MYQFLIIADLLSYLFLVLIDLGMLDSWRLLIAIAFYLIGKAFMFKDTMSILDGIVGLYAILLIFGFNFWFIYFVIMYGIYKVVSLIG